MAFKQLFECEFCGKTKYFFPEQAIGAKCECETKSELEIMKKKFESGEYVCIAISKQGHVAIKKVRILQKNEFSFNYSNNLGLCIRIHKGNHYIYYKEWEGCRFELIHKKHKHILDAFLKDNSVEIEFHSKDDLWFLVTDFIEQYEEDFDYRLKPKEEYPQYRINEDGEVFAAFNNKKYTKLLTKDYNLGGRYYNFDFFNKLKPIPYNKKRGLYHKQPVWGIGNKSERNIMFYKEDNKCYEINGTNNIQECDNIEPITPEQLKVMPFIWDMYKQLKD